MMADERRQCLLQSMLIFVPFGQAGQDRFVYEQLIKPNPGYKGTFLDIGCNDYRWNSNSYGLEKFFGWRGLLVDNDPVMCELCRQNRSNPVLEADASKVDWKTLYQVNNLSFEVDYLSLDVDDWLHCGILQDLLTAGFSFKVITVEHDRYVNGDEPRNSIRGILLSQGYKLAVPDAKVKIDGKFFEFEDWFLR